MNNSEFDYARYILDYSKDFGGNLSDEDCFRKMVFEKDGANLVQFTLIKKEMEQMSQNEIDDLKKVLHFTV